MAGSETIRQAVTRLRRRAPLGATRLVPALDAATRALAGKRPGSVLYIGDGMSSAELVNADDFKQVLAGFATGMFRYTVTASAPGWTCRFWA
ncbi:MAG: hypothetical protein CM1200mP2_46830 [Planctomycetaceae bacterium]|nr:MAG: hypothetical protein CM1200mP2_46830 [Planctomycetaceae bacterium]